MTSTTTRGRGLAIAAGAIFTAGTCAILFEDLLLKAAPFQLKHGLALAVLTGTILAGHLANDARRARHWLAAVGFALVFVAGTALVVYSSVGRQAADTIQTTAQIEADAGRRVEIGRARARSADMLDSAQRALATECKSGRGSRCDGIRTTIEVYTAAIAGHDAALARLGPVRVASPEAEQLAEIAHVVLGADKAKVKAAAVLAVPFLLTLFLEFGTIVSLGFASSGPRVAAGSTKESRHAPSNNVTPAQAGAHDNRPADSDAAGASDYPALDDLAASNVLPFFRPDTPNGASGADPHPRRPDNRRGGGTPDRPRTPNRPAPSAPDKHPDGPAMGKQEILAALVTDLALGRTFGSQDELAERFGRSKSTMSDWLREWEAAGLIPARRTVGRRKEIAG